MISSRKHGFTLVEVLLVIAILGLLAGMLFPAFRRSRAKGRQLRCASNLHQIGVACACHMADDQISKARPLIGPGWTGELLTYLHNPEIMMCPGDRGFTGGTAGAGDAGRSGPAGIVVNVWGRYDMPLEDGPLTRREELSETSYILRFEDIRPTGGDMDFNDLVLQVDELSDGRVRISVVSIDAGYRFSLLGPDRQGLLHDLHQHVGESIVASSVKTSYGINSMVRHLELGARSILLLDYPKDVADCAGPDAMDDWDDWTDRTGLPSFARHLGRCNVLFADGSVQALSPVDIDPDDPKLAREYWLP